MIARVGQSFNLLLMVLIPTMGISWVLGIQDYFFLPVVTQQMVAVMLGMCAAAAFLQKPYSVKANAQAGVVDIVCAVLVMSAWCWYAWNFEGWMLLLASRTPDMWLPGAVALILMFEGLRKTVGLAIAMLVWLVIAYGLFGDLIPGALQAEVFPVTKTILYLYADTNGVPGLVVTIIINVVLPFVIFGKAMEIAGGMRFFNNLALSLMGHRRGGPAKVAVVASGSFGTLSGSTVANIMSTGVMTIPLMKRTGFSAKQSAAIEAVASNGGQLMPPVMGATAFIMAEFLEIPYQEVVVAALVPALLYYLVLFLKIDAVAVRENIAGLPRTETPLLLPTLKTGWPFILPLASVIWLLFWKGYEPGQSALAATAILLVGYVLQQRFRPDWQLLKDSLLAAGKELVPLVLIGGGAGAIIGMMNSTGFAFQLSLLLTHIASAYGLLVMLMLAAVVSIILGMGMPTAAVYIVLVTVVAPAVVRLGVEPLAAHLFLFYFGLLSMITPPIAIGSIVAAQLAKSNMWTTGFYAMRLGIAAYLLPFLWVYNPGVLLNAGWSQIVIVLSNCIVSALLLRQSMLPSPWRGLPEWLNALLLFALAVGVGSASLWIGQTNPLALLPSIAGLLFVLFLSRQSGSKLYPA